MTLDYDPFASIDDTEVKGGTVRSLAAFKMTDYGNAERLVQMFGDEMLWVPPWKVWLVWDGKRWRPDEDGQVERNAKTTIRSLYAAAAASDNEDTRKALNSHAARSEGAARLTAMMTLAQSELRMSVMPHQLDAHPWLLNVQNGTLNLQSGELTEHDRKDLLTKVLAVPYEPKAKCPRWDQFLKEVLPDNEVRAFLHRAVGYSLTGLTVEEVMFILLGPGSNGKSKMLETLRLLFGPFSQNAPTALLMQKAFESIPADLARLPGARFVTVIESERGQRMAEGTIKSITSGDRITARGLYQSPFEFNPACKVWLATNHLPEIKGDDDGIWRRIMLINFDQRITGDKRDKHLLDKLREELPGILRWAVEGCVAWQAGFAPPETVRKAVAEYRDQMDVFGQFLNESTKDDPEGFVSTDALFAEYKLWCDRSGVRYPMRKSDLGKLLSERGYKPGRRDAEESPVVRVKNSKAPRHRLRGWLGLTLSREGDA